MPRARSAASRSAARGQQLGRALGSVSISAQRALDEPAAEHAGLPVRRIVERARLPGGDAVLAFEQIDLDGAGSARKPCGLRRAGRTPLDEHLAARLEP